MKRTSLVAFIKTYYPWIVVFLLFLFIFRKVFFQGLYPYPGDLLVSFFFPYSSGGWEGYTSWITHKEFVSADVVRQLYPWRELSIDLLKQGILPLWNPYAFSGTPLAANLQSAAFYPVNLIFFLVPFFPAWITYILLQPILACIGMYLFLKSLKRSSVSAVFSGLAFGFIGYLGIWFELGVVGHTAAWLPFVLWGVTEYATTKQRRFLLISSAALGCTVLAGHAQTAAYVFLLSAAYFWFVFGVRRTTILPFLTIFGLGAGTAALQLLPSLELLFMSARDVASSAEIFRMNRLPIDHLVTILAPDFFGNQTTGNYWGKNYGEFMAYVGVVTVSLSVVGMTNYFSDRTVRFFLITGIIAVLFAVPGPFSEALLLLKIPVLSSGIPARSLFLFSFSLVVIAAYGLESIREKKNSLLLPLGIVTGCYAFLWLTVTVTPKIITDTALQTNFAIAQRNLILPTVIFVATAVILFFIRRFPRLLIIGMCCIFFFAAFEYQYFLYKFSPFAPSTYLYPDHPVVTKLQEMSDTSRVFGYQSARLETNLPTAWRLQSPEGYDPLYIKQYGELMAAGKTGHFSRDIPRSDALFADATPTTDPHAKRVLLDLMNVRYIADKNDQARSTPDTTMYPEAQYRRIWHDRKWNIYESTAVLPRTAVFYHWEEERSDEETVRRLFSPEFSYRDTLVLSATVPNDSLKKTPPTPAQIEAYTANRVQIRATAATDGVLFLSDAYYPGWNVYLDGKKTELLRADYAFRAVAVPKGTHSVVFQYEPMSFYIGAVISGISVLVLGGLAVRETRKNRKKMEKRAEKEEKE